MLFKKSKEKIMLKKIIATIMLFITIFSMTSISTVFAATLDYFENDDESFLSTDVVNNDIIMNISQKGNEELYTGEVHKVTISASYANPNHQDKKARIYLQNSDGSANNDVILTNFIDGRLDLVTNIDEINISAELKSDDTGRYIEYDLVSGTSIEMEIEILWPNGNGASENILVLHPEIYDENLELDPSSEKLEDKILIWRSRFGYENLEKFASTNQLSIDSTNNLFNDDTLEYEFYVDNIYEDEQYGTTYTKKISFVDEITLPEGISFGDFTQDGNSLINENLEKILEIQLDDSVSNQRSKDPGSSNEHYTFGTLENVSFELIEGNTLRIIGEIVNDAVEDGMLVKELYGVSALKIVLTTNKLDLVNSEFILNLDDIDNVITCTFVSAKDESIELTASASVSIVKDKASLIVYKRDALGNVVTNDTAKFELINRAGQNVYATESSDGVYVASENGSGETVFENNKSTGRLQITGLLTGQYVLKEVEEPNGFALNTEEVSVEIASGTASIDVTDELGDKSIIVNKVDTMGEPIANQATFNLYNSDRQLLKFKLIASDEDGNHYVYYENGSSSVRTYNGKINFYGLENGGYILKEITAPTGYKLNSEEASINIQDNTASVSFVNRELRYANLIINKVDENNELITSGTATFEVYNSSNTRVGTISTVNGVATLENLSEGSYYIREIAAPTGYRILTTRKEFVVTENTDTDISINFRNERIKYGNLNVTKVDAEGSTITSGSARFELYTDDDTLVETFSTVSGIVSKTLEVGDYYIKEINAPSGYKITNEITYFSIKDGEDTDITVKNEEIKYGTLNINKVDQYGALVTSGTTYFELRKDGTFYRQLSTSSGKISIQLETGNYTLVETRAPSGYTKSDEEKQFSITESGTVNIDFVNTRIEYGNLVINKVDELGNLINKSDIPSVENGSPIQGAEDVFAAKFELYKSGETQPIKVLTTSYGTITESNLEAGDYYLKEIQAPLGYSITDDIVNFTITGNEDTIVNVQNTKNVVGSLQIHKMGRSRLDENILNPLKGAHFTLKLKITEDGKEAFVDYAVGVTDENGDYTFTNLPMGDYVLVETEAPDGYIEVEDRAVSITDDSTVYLELIDEPETSQTEPIKIYLQKEDEDGNPITGDFATFNVNGTSYSTSEEDGRVLLYEGIVEDDWSISYEITETKAPTGYALNKETMEVSLTAQDINGTYVIHFVNYPAEDVTIRKVDEDGNLITTGSAKFDVTIDGETTEYTTVDGTVVVPAVAVGKTITIKETEAPEGYKLDATTHEYVAIEDGVNTVDITNIKYVTATIRKVDEEGNLITDGYAEFRVTVDGAIRTVRTEGGIATIENVPTGSTIIVRETVAPDGYVLNTTTHHIPVDKNQDNTYEIENISGRSLTIEKVDEDGQLITTGTALFQVTMNGTATAYTTSNGVATVPNIAVGTEVTVKELTAPYGYALDSTEHTITIAKDEENKVSVTNKKAKDVTVAKTDDDGYLVTSSRAGFKVYSKDLGRYLILEYDDTENKWMYTGSTDGNSSNATVIYTDDGIVNISGLSVGEYRLYETVTPTDYRYDRNYTDFSVDAIDNATVESENSLPEVEGKVIPPESTGSITVVNVQNFGQGRIDITILDENGNLITDEDAVVTINNNESITISNGHYTSGEMDIGEYTIKEVTAPYGYELNDVEITKEVTVGGITYFEIRHTRLPDGELKLNKVDDDGNLITSEPATFSIYNEDGTLYVGNVSTENGILTYSLPLGEYYVVEEEEPYGYLLSERQYKFTITPGETTEIDFKNEKILTGEVEISKLDVNSDLITNDSAQFKIYDAENNVMKFVKDDIKGMKIHFASDFYLERVSYDWIEIYYLKDGNTYRYSDGSTYKFSSTSLANRTITIPGDEFYIWLRTDGTKTYRGFEIDSIEFLYEDVVRSDSAVSLPSDVKETLEYQDDNYPKTNNPYSNNMRTLYHYVNTNSGKYIPSEYDGEEIIETTDGKIMLELFLGDYSLEEVKAPEGYIVSDERQEFTITADNYFDKLDIEVVNEYNNIGQLVIEKKDARMNNYIEAPAKFNLLDNTGTAVALKYIDTNDSDGNIYELSTVESENTITELETYKGKIKVQNITWGEYEIAEIEAPEEYGLATENTPVTIDVNCLFNPITKTVYNTPNVGNIKLSKIDDQGDIISDDAAIFKIYDENQNVVKFDLVDGNYVYNVNGTITFVYTTEGVANIKKLPIGTYTLEEVAAPDGYLVNNNKATFTVTADDYYVAGDISFINNNYEFGIDNAASISYITVEEIGNEENNATGYLQDNKITVDSSLKQVKYTLNVSNMSVKNFENIVLINKLPSVNDTGNVNLSEERESGYNIILDSDDIEVYIKNAEGERTLIDSSEYTIEFTDAIEYTEDDWNGEGTVWNSEFCNTAKAFRIKLNNLKLSAGNSVEVDYIANIADTTTPGMVAWNNFGYRFNVGDVVLIPEPAKVGVEIENEYISKTVTKVWDDEILQNRRPEGIVLQLFADDEVVGEKEISTTEDEVTVTFDNLPKYNGLGEEIVYTAAEKELTDGDLEWYTAETNNQTLTITNKLKDIPTSVLVHYYIEGTEEKLSEDVLINGNVGEEYVTTVADDIPSEYELVAEPVNKTGEMEENQIVVIYYFRLKEAKVIVHHYEEGTTNKVSENVEINGRINDPYTTTPATDIPAKYELSREPDNKTGYMTEEVTHVIYYYKVKDTTLTVKYLEKGTNEVLAPQDERTGKIDEEYTTRPKDIDGYTYVEDSGNTQGWLTVEPTVVIYYYLQQTKATVQHIDKLTGEILEQSTEEGLVGDEFVTDSKDFEGYILVEEPPEKTVLMTKDEIVLKYYYIHVAGGVIEKHIDIHSGAILYNASYEGKEGDPYKIDSREFEGYDLVEDRLPTNAEGTMTREPIEVIYYYSYRTKVTAQYIDKITGEKLTTDEVQNGHVGDPYTTETKEFDGYELVAVPDNKSGDMTREPIVVIYYYVHDSAGVVENHYDIITGEKLTQETRYEGHEGDEYKTTPKDFEGYDLVEERYPSNAEGTMTKEEIRVDYYYIKKTEVRVKHVDKATGEELVPTETIPGHEGDPYTTDPKDIPGYVLIEEPENADGEMTKDIIEVIYYYARPAEVIVNHIDKDTNEKLADEEIIEGFDGDEYKTEEKEFEYYNLVEKPENAEGVMKVEVVDNVVNNKIYVTYYYTKKPFNLKVDKIVLSVVQNGQEKSINSDLGKAEIYRKDVDSAGLQVIYSIKVTNDGEIAGKATLLENIPSGLIMNPSYNPNWSVSGSTATLETEVIQPGETKEYRVALDWANGGNNVGNKENTVEIINTSNEAGFEETNLDDNKDNAVLVIAISTGTTTYMAIAGGMLIVLAGIAICINYKKRKQK